MKYYEYPLKNHQKITLQIHWTWTINVYRMRASQYPSKHVAAFPEVCGATWLLLIGGMGSKIGEYLRRRETKGAREVESEIERRRVKIGDTCQDDAFAAQVGQVCHVFPPHHPHPNYSVPHHVLHPMLACLSPLVYGGGVREIRLTS